MYIHPFLAGVLSTVVFEVLVIVGWGIAYAQKDKRK